MKNVETGEEIIEVGEGHRRDNPLSNKTIILQNMEKREKERSKLYGDKNLEGFKKLDLNTLSLNGEDETKKKMLINQLDTMYQEIQYMQQNGLWRELKEVREMFLKAFKIHADEEYRQKDEMSTGQLRYDQLKEIVNKMIHFVVGWQCNECNISDTIETLIEELTIDADSEDKTLT